jgi:hypothetical protein
VTIDPTMPAFNRLSFFIVGVNTVVRVTLLP